MPSITADAAQIALLRRCFSAARGMPCDLDPGDDPQNPKATASAYAILAAALPNRPVAFPPDAWGQFIARVTVGAECLAEIPGEDHLAVLRLIGAGSD